MITNGFTYVALLLFLAGVLVTLEKKTGWKFFKFIPAVVLLYLIAMLLCTLKVWVATFPEGAERGASVASFAGGAITI